jgi:nucleoside-diphosphate-sugar epimerase
MLRRVLITGASGFVGRHVVAAWQAGEIKTTTLGRALYVSDRDHIPCDLAEHPPDLGDRAFETVVHCAGKAHTVPKNRAESDDFFRVNVDGTKNLLSSLESGKQRPDRIVLVSTVAVYGMSEGIEIPEASPLIGKTPYAESKIRAEELITDWASKNNIRSVILRLPLVVGVDPPGNLGRMAASIKRGTYVRIKNNHARKSVVLASDVAQIIRSLDSQTGIYNLTDGTDPEFREIEDAIAAALRRSIHFQIPASLLKTGCSIGDRLSLAVNTDLFQKLTCSLTFSSDLARQKLGWKPRSCLDFLKNTKLS